MGVPEERHAWCDGIRGWAALTVAVYHNLQQWHVIPSFYKQTLVLDGSFAVVIFFAVSGFSLRCVRDERAIVRTALCRWPRLALPCFMHYGVAFTFLYPNDWYRHIYMAAYASFYAFFPLVGGMFSTPPHLVSEMYNLGSSSSLVLWTMEFEMLASMIIFACSLASRHVRQPSVPCLATVMALTFACCPKLCFFLVGAIHQSRWETSDRVIRPVALLCSMVALGFSTFEIWTWGWQLVALIRVATLLQIVRESHHARSFLSARVSTHMGSISFSMYLCHYYVMHLVYRYAPQKWGIGVSLACSLALAAATAPFDRWSMSKCKAVAAHLLKPEDAPKAVQTTTA